MVQVLESWFLADKKALRTFYGRGFRANAIPGDLQVERIGKRDVLGGLARAARNTQKGRYAKGSHCFGILAELEPSTVESAAPHAKRFLETLRAGEELE